MIIKGRKGFLPGFLKGFISIVFLFFISCQQWGMKDKTKVVNPSVFQWEYATPESQGMLTAILKTACDTLALKGTRKLVIVRNDKIVFEWFAPGWEDSTKTHFTASLAKAIINGMSLVTALDDGYIHLDEPACNFVPSWKVDNKKSKITVRHLATHTSGLDDAQPTREESERLAAKGLHRKFDLPDWRGSFWRVEDNPFLDARDNAPVLFTPGTGYQYSNPGIAMVTYCVTKSLEGSPYSNIKDYLDGRIFGPIGIDKNSYEIGYGHRYQLDGLDLVPSWGGAGFKAEDIARIGLLMLHKGNWMGTQLLDSSSVEAVTKYYGTALPQQRFGQRAENQSEERLPQETSAGWYSNSNGKWTNVPRDAFAGAGAQDQHLLVIPSLNIVVVRMGNDLKGSFQSYVVDPVMDAIIEPPYPKSDISAEFVPADSVIRLAEGGDNWPATWADDGDIYTAYGDGNGFLPNTEIKLSLGLAKIIGNPPAILGTNLRSSTGETVGQGRAGVKASGILMVDGVLYMLTRNDQNAGLLWSSDHGQTWEEADWKFDVSFGCPTFLNYGKNYDGAKDNYVYIYSQDEASAYKNSDRYVMARVPKDQIKNWREYEFFAGCDKNDNPKWTDDIRKREAVFTNPGRCYRSGITYNKGLKRYLWCQIIQLSREASPRGPRFKGGLGIFESQNPWGPWKTVYYTRDFDIGPGETASIPTKWMSEDGKTCYMLSSGDDCMSIRKFTLKTK